MTGDDSVCIAPFRGAFEPDRVVALLPDGGRMTWERESGSLKAKQPYLLTFRVDDRNGRPARDLALYMGMPGHAIILRRDLSVFAHVHPSGTAPMASIALARETQPSSSTADKSSTAADPHAQHASGFGRQASGIGPQANPHAQHAQHGQGDATIGAQDVPHADNLAPLPATVTFPYGFPRAGEYRLFVQVKRGAGVQTGVFDVRVAEP